MIDSSRVLETTVRAGKLAAEVCRRVQREDVIPGLDKSDKSPVTVADFASQAVILRELGAEFPDHAILSEEDSSVLRQQPDVAERVRSLVSDAIGESCSLDQVYAWIDHAGERSSPFCWAIDPIDGTKGFLRRDQYAVAMGLLHEHQPFAGVLVCPSLAVTEGSDQVGVIFTAFRGEGASQSPLDGGSSASIRVRGTDDYSQVRMLGSVESSHGDPKLLTSLVETLGLGEVVRVDSQVKYAVLARGGAEIYLRPRSRPDWRDNAWDHVAGVVVAAEAGAHSTDQDGKPLDFSFGARMENNRGVLTTNGVIHDAVVAAIQRCEAQG